MVVDVGIPPAALLEAERLYPGDEARRRQLKSKGSFLTGDVEFTGGADGLGDHPRPRGRRPLTVAMVIAGTLKASRLRQELRPGVSRRSVSA